jgi:hypothetical protein
VYVRDYRQFDRWSSRQLKAAAFVWPRLPGFAKEPIL